MNSFLQDHSGLFLLALLWTLPWKGIALWKAAKLSQKNWFIVLLVVNTLAILDIIYIFAVARKKEESRLAK
ncbi:MAG: hypothetical protein AUJ39_00860 [Parcubacteria group bacterium CG1_02_42_13]|uniref:DUF5652 domain-containing protein n=1 Tax=Candidatus Colwellbacteria bacterium CG23_combo_of_CG06-09_8_20_14_all_42_19 TaxID=1974541 RepID=A0A2H0ANG5_9BACT|nr:MAG: hypothetical protein AUJ39_00860 [Parcubacteria group bacterium CG1_02_42_13]PIP46158.1 MAG: hypothetical protein COX15_01360 [Candidatus Colwellbacteria bacterium CG23_combo_of_CG06-09_8_20_14_all_42_19]